VNPASSRLSPCKSLGQSRTRAKRFRRNGMRPFLSVSAVIRASGAIRHSKASQMIKRKLRCLAQLVSRATRARCAMLSTARCARLASLVKRSAMPPSAHHVRIVTSVKPLVTPANVPRARFVIPAKAVSRCSARFVSNATRASRPATPQCARPASDVTNVKSVSPDRAAHRQFKGEV
jgi:hypothetical protein